MTAQAIADKALSLLGYTETTGSSSGERYSESAKNAVNSVYADLFYLVNERGFHAVSSMAEEILLPERLQNDVMPYGVASFIAAAVSDGEKQQFYADLYNLKRKGIGEDKAVKDVLPRF